MGDWANAGGRLVWLPELTPVQRQPASVDPAVATVPLGPPNAKARYARRARKGEAATRWLREYMARYPQSARGNLDTGDFVFLPPGDRREAKRLQSAMGAYLQALPGNLYGPRIYMDTYPKQMRDASLDDYDQELEMLADAESRGEQQTLDTALGALDQAAAE